MIALTYFTTLREPHGRRVTTTWERLLARLSVHRIVDDKHAAPGLSLATFAGDRRALANVERVYAVGLDLDHNVDWGDLTYLFGDCDSFAHTTWSSTPEEPRARVFLRLARPVAGDEYRRVYASVVGRCEGQGLTIDRAASDPSRFWFLPSTRPGAEFHFSIGRGKPVNVDWALATTPAAIVPPPPVSSAPPSSTPGNVEARAAAYLARCEPAISGQGGHTRTFVIAQKLVLGFGLDEETAYRLMLGWNAQCQPPWSAHDLRRKLRQAAERGHVQPGSLRDADRRAS